MTVQPLQQVLLPAQALLLRGRLGPPLPVPLLLALPLLPQLLAVGQQLPLVRLPLLLHLLRRMAAPTLRPPLQACQPPPPALPLLPLLLLPALPPLSLWSLGCLQAAVQQLGWAQQAAQLQLAPPEPRLPPLLV